MKKPLMMLLLLLSLTLPIANAEEPQYVRMPWHLVDLWWDIGQDVPFESYSIDVTISEDVPASTNLYIAPVGLGHLSKTAFYGGIQTQADGNTKSDPKLRKLGPGLPRALRSPITSFCCRHEMASVYQQSYCSVKSTADSHSCSASFAIRAERSL